MTIRILTCHPALRYVLERTAPVGTTVRGNQNAKHDHESLCQIDIESKINKAEVEARVLQTWLPDYVLYYGARLMEINGRAIECDAGDLRRALRPARKSRAA
jgi:hypothetical protein